MLILFPYLKKTIIKHPHEKRARALMYDVYLKEPEQLSDRTAGALAAVTVSTTKDSEESVKLCLIWIEMGI